MGETQSEGCPPRFFFIPRSLGKGAGDREPVLSLPKEGEGFEMFYKRGLIRLK